VQTWTERTREENKVKYIKEAGNKGRCIKEGIRDTKNEVHEEQNTWNDKQERGKKVIALKVEREM
jgi:hypothetical protein